MPVESPKDAPPLTMERVRELERMAFEGGWVFTEEVKLSDLNGEYRMTPETVRMGGDNLPLTEEWLKSLGVKDERTESKDPDYGWTLPGPGWLSLVCSPKEGWGLYAVGAGGFDGSQKFICDMPTRGRLLHLLRGLGITIPPAPITPAVAG